jgi:hypothetical protein
MLFVLLSPHWIWLIWPPVSRHGHSILCVIVGIWIWRPFSSICCQRSRVCVRACVLCFGDVCCLSSSRGVGCIFSGCAKVCFFDSGLPGMWHCVAGRIFPDVLEDDIAFETSGRIFLTMQRHFSEGSYFAFAADFIVYFEKKVRFQPVAGVLYEVKMSALCGYYVHPSVTHSRTRF